MSSVSPPPEGILLPDAPGAPRTSWVAGGLTALRWLLFALALWSLLWPAYRVFVNVEIDPNEGWNAYLADAAMGRGPLYPSPATLVTNNYPPLSFYIVGGLGKLVGDPILAGRLCSLVAVLVIAGAIGMSLRVLGGDRAAASVGGAVWVVAIAHFCDGYVGMDDPQLLAQAIMAMGFVWFLRVERDGRGCLAPILLMLGAGFVKHNIIAMPLTALIWLGIHRLREAVKCAAVSVFAMGCGFALCFAFYGRDFFSNMLIARQCSWMHSLYSAGLLHSVDVALGTTVLLGIFRWRDREVRLCLLLTVIALGTFFLQRTGAGVDKNAIFELMIAVSVGTGLAYWHLGRMAATRFLTGPACQALLVLFLCIRMLPMDRQKPDYAFRLLFDPSFKKEIAMRERATMAAAEKARSIPGPVMGSTYVCYRSGKPFAVDEFNTLQRMATGALPPGTLEMMLARGQLKKVKPGPLADWHKPVDLVPESQTGSQ